MTSQRQQQEVDRNYDAFMGVLDSILAEHRDELALMRDGRIVGYFDTPREAARGCVRAVSGRHFLDSGSHGRADLSRRLVGCLALNGDASGVGSSCQCRYFDPLR